MLVIKHKHRIIIECDEWEAKNVQFGLLLSAVHEVRNRAWAAEMYQQIKDVLNNAV